MVLMNAPKEEEEDEEEKDMTRMDTDITDEEMAMRCVEEICSSSNIVLYLLVINLLCTLLVKATVHFLVDMGAWLKA